MAEGNISSHIGTEALKYCSEEGNETSLNWLTWILLSAYHGCTPSPPSVPILSSARTLTAFPAYIMTISMHFTSLPFPSSCKRANFSSEANFQQGPPSAQQHHWFLTTAHTQPCAPHPTPVGEEISSSSKLTYFLLNLPEETAEKLYLVSCASACIYQTWCGKWAGNAYPVYGSNSSSSLHDTFEQHTKTWPCTF